MKSVFRLPLMWCAAPAIVVLMSASSGLRAEEKGADKKTDPSAKTVNTESSSAKLTNQGKPLPTDAELKKMLTPIQYAVTQQSGTERPFTNEFWEHKDEGIYVDIVSGKPLFSSKDKFDTDCGWPGFAKPINDDEVKNLVDRTHGMERTEVRSSTADSHLGHVFNDGPKEMGGLRYCINSAALRFVPKDKMKEAGYGELHDKIFGGGQPQGQQTAAKKEENRGAADQ